MFYFVLQFVEFVLSLFTELLIKYYSLDKEVLELKDAINYALYKPWVN